MYSDWRGAQKIGIYFGANLWRTKNELSNLGESNRCTLFTINELYILETSKLMHKFNHDHLPPIFKNLFRLNITIHNISTRSKHNYHVPYFSKSISQQSIAFKGVKVWNALPSNIKTLQSQSAFTFKLKKNLLQLRQTSD